MFCVVVCACVVCVLCVYSPLLWAGFLCSFGGGRGLWGPFFADVGFFLPRESTVSFPFVMGCGLVGTGCGLGGAVSPVGQEGHVVLSWLCGGRDRPEADSERALGRLELAHGQDQCSLPHTPHVELGWKK